MANVLRVKSRWSGFSGAPGYTLLHFRDFTGTAPDNGDPTAAQATAAVARTKTFFEAIRSTLPNSVSIQVESEVEVIEDTTGQLTNTFAATPVTVTVGSGGTDFAGPIGAVINWRTTAVRNGRRVRGRTFLVPLRGLSFDATGALGATSRTTLVNAATALADTTGSPDLGVLARPSSTGATDGQWHPVSGASVPSMAAVLRSRRD